MHIFENQILRAQVRQEMEVEPALAACGEFIKDGYVSDEREDEPKFALVPPGIRWMKGMIAIRAWGNSMEPRIRDGAWILGYQDCISNDPEGRIVLVKETSEYGRRFALKRFHRRDDGKGDLQSLNKAHPPIELSDVGPYCIHGWFVASVAEIEFVEKAGFRYVYDVD